MTRLPFPSLLACEQAEDAPWPALLQEAHTPDDLALLACGCSCVLGWSAPEAELSQMVGVSPLETAEQVRAFQRHLEHCLALDRLLILTTGLTVTLFPSRSSLPSPVSSTLFAIAPYRYVRDLAPLVRHHLNATRGDDALRGRLIRQLEQHEDSLLLSSLSLQKIVTIPQAAALPLFPVDRLQSLLYAHTAWTHLMSDAMHIEQCVLAPYRAWWLRVAQATFTAATRCLTAGHQQMQRAAQLAERTQQILRLERQARLVVPARPAGAGFREEDVP